MKYWRFPNPQASAICFTEELGSLNMRSASLKRMVSMSLFLDWSVDGPTVLRDIRTGEFFESRDSVFALLVKDSKDRLFIS